MSGAVEIPLHSFLSSTLNADEGNLHTLPSLLPDKTPIVHMTQECEWAPNWSGCFGEEEKPVVHDRYETFVRKKLRFSIKLMQIHYQ
jgi:hypothetical protein